MKRLEPAADRLFRNACVVLLLTLLPVSPLRSGHKDGPREERSKDPKILLTVSPAFGFSPLTVQMVGTLTGVDSRDPNFCHAEITWTRVEPGSSPERSSRITEAPRCLHGESEISVTTTFSKVFDLYRPGPYLYQLIITGKDGTQIRSNMAKVQVMRVP
jgi:hypothetical protein